VAGGTTAEIISRRTGEEVVVHLESQRAGVPPWGELKGVELVTEGVITLGTVLNDWKEKEGASEPDNREPSAAEKMSVLLKQADTVTIITGSGTQRNELIERLSRLLRSEGKAVIINRY
jgi:ABC-type microcin C transport system duplicated ATPase subunit YejF